MTKRLIKTISFGFETAFENKNSKDELTAKV
jgi:hypothetical protein